MHAMGRLTPAPLTPCAGGAAWPLARRQQQRRHAPLSSGGLGAAPRISSSGSGPGGRRALAPPLRVKQLTVEEARERRDADP